MNILLLQSRKLPIMILDSFLTDSELKLVACRSKRAASSECYSERVLNHPCPVVSIDQVHR